MISGALQSLPPIPPQSVFTGNSGSAATADGVRSAIDLTGNRTQALGAREDTSLVNDDDFLTMLANLMREGIVGTETRDANGRPVERFISTSIGDESLRGLPYFRGPEAGSRFNRLA